MRRLSRVVGVLLVLAGVGTLLWALVVWRWQDPFTALYNAYHQRQLAQDYDARVAAYRGPLGTDSLAAARRKLAQEARAYRRSVGRSDVVGRIVVPRLDLDAYVVNGTDSDTLKRGPGRDLRTFMPGEGELVYIAGHRTTYGAPFAQIDALRPGDRVMVDLPYARFEYRIIRHVIVPASDVGRLRSSGRELLALQACHPRFFASERYIAYATPVRIVPRGGRAIAPATGAVQARAP
jgi:sortase A